jgi:hypothetical protein
MRSTSYSVAVVSISTLPRRFVRREPHVSVMIMTEARP